MIKIVFNFLMIAGIILGIIFMVFTSFSKKGNDKVVVYLNLVVLFLTLNNLQICLVDSGYIEVNFFVRKLLIPWYALILPSLYTFLSYYLRVEKRVYPIFRISISIFVLELLIRIVLIPFFYYENNNYVVAKYAQIEEIANAIFTIAVFIKAFVLVFKYSKLFQYVLTFDNIKWLKNLMFLGSVTLLMWVCAIVLNLDKVVNPEIYIYYPMRLSSSVILYWMGYQGFFNYSMMTERIQLRKALVKETKYTGVAILEKNKITDEKFLKIKAHVENNKRYLDPVFSIAILSAETKISGNALSQIINKATQSHFSDYINSLRIEKAKQFLVSPEYSSYDIASIGFECGFNSKSAFYASFKKFTNQTPSSYRAENACSFLS